MAEISGGCLTYLTQNLLQIQVSREIPWHLSGHHMSKHLIHLERKSSVISAVHDRSLGKSEEEEVVGKHCLVMHIPRGRFEPR